MSVPIEWLLEGEPWVEYRTLCDLLRQPEDDPLVQSARRGMLADPGVQTLVAELSAWPGTVISSRKSARQPFHKHTFVADLGLRPTDPGVDVVVAKILRSKADALGRFTPESVWTAGKGWEFGQKKAPSRWLTLLAWRILGRVDLGLTRPIFIRVLLTGLVNPDRITPDRLSSRGESNAPLSVHILHRVRGHRAHRRRPAAGRRPIEHGSHRRRRPAHPADLRRRHRRGPRDGFPGERRGRAAQTLRRCLGRCCGGDWRRPSARGGSRRRGSNGRRSE